MSTEEAIVKCPICQETAPQGYLLCPFCGADLTLSYQEKVFTPLSYKEVFGRIRSFIIRPRKIGEEIADNPDSKAGFLSIVAISFGMAFQILSLLMHNYLFNWRLPIIFLLTWIFAFVLPAVAWGFASWFIRTFARLLGGKANKKQIRSAVGYGLILFAVISLFNALLYLIALPWNRVDLAEFGDVFQSMRDMRNSFAGITGLIFNLIGILVAGIYIIYIVKPASNFSFLESAIATGIPVLIFLILLLTYYFVA